MGSLILPARRAAAAAVLGASMLLAQQRGAEAAARREGPKPAPPTSTRSAARDLEITLVYDNNAYGKGLETAWGFACVVKAAEKTILFDTGGSAAMVLRNMEKLGLSPKDIDVIVLSHIHGDHVGGLFGLLEKNAKVDVYLPESFPRSFKAKARKYGAKVIEVTRPVKICKNVHSTGEMGAWIKEEALVIETSKGLVVVTGCAHPGIAAIVRQAKRMLKTPVYLAVGGFHLCWMSGSQIDSVVSGMRKEGVKKVAPCHCSGNLARKAFQKAYGKDFIPSGVGKKLQVKDAF